MASLTSRRRDKQRCRPLNNAARERSRVQSLRAAFLELQKSLPSVPPDTKLSKLDILVLATAYIYHLTSTLNEPMEMQESETAGIKQKTLESASAHLTLPRSGRKNDNVKSDVLSLKKYQQESHYQSKAQSLKRFLTKLPNADGDSHKQCLARYTPICSQAANDFPRESGNVNMAISEQNIKKTAFPVPVSTCCKTLEMKSRVPTHKKGAVGIMHPVKKWPMRCRLYQHILGFGPVF